MPSQHQVEQLRKGRQISDAEAASLASGIHFEKRRWKPDIPASAWIAVALLAGLLIGNLLWAPAQAENRQRTQSFDR